MRTSIRLAMVATVFFCLSFSVGAAEVVTLNPATTGLVFEVGEDKILHLQVSEVRLDRIEIAGADWTIVQVPGGHNLMDRGLPSLPYLSSEYLLDRTGGIEVELVSLKLREIDLGARDLEGVAPSKGHFDRNVDPESVPWTFDDKVYQGAARYPRDDVWVDRPHIAGPLRGQTLRFPLAHWRPDTNTLLVVEEAWFRVVDLTNADNPRFGPDRPLTGLFEASARLHAVNYESFRGRTLPFVETGRLLIIADPEFLDEIAPLAEWETLVGYPTTVVSTAVTGNTTTSIKAFIQSVYDEPEGLAWIILVGDSPQIPTLTGVHSQHSPCDACYTRLEGADNRADAAISRISAVDGDQVTVQVSKILAYEQQPDIGSAGAWYQAGFGIGSDDTGGTGLADWERIELLRGDLMEPVYTYTEFDQIYHSSATAGQVSTAVNEGRSMGLYIGHGSSSGWVTTGFNTTSAHNLTNSEMLPTIWSVACNNGEFTVTECFAEAWLRSDAGGAVSFEGGTTTESWVPPCDAQRAIVDAVRLETAFTTGGQHMAGKQGVMDLHGDSNSSEGNKWVEQSALFGSCTTWMRTLPAVSPDEPEDFSSAGGVVSLTVKVGGAPLAKAGAAIVSFYDSTGGVDVVGSGLIDDNGVVTATVTGDPTHCHIHGQNLIPTSFELGARDAGRISLDGAAYACADTVTLRVADSNIPGSSPGTIDTTTVELATGGATHTVTLTEVAADRDIFVGTAVLGTDLAVANGDTLVATYIDADDGDGGVNISRTADAGVDCLGPVITDIQATAVESSVSFSYTTDEPGTTVVVYGETAPPSSVVSDDTLTTDHQISIDGVSPCTTYLFEVRSADALNNLTSDSNGGAFHRVDTAGWASFFSETFDSDPGWTIDNGNFATTGWAFGEPTGSGQDNYGGPDPTAGFTGVDVYGVNLEGDAPANVGDNEIKLTTPVIDLSAATSVRLRFRRWLGVEQNIYDHARVRLSLDGGNSWQAVWENGSTTIDDQAWIEQVVELPQAVGQNQVRIQWTYGSADSLWNYCGWNIDDVVVEGGVPCGTVSPLFADGFEIGSCGMWSTVVGEN